MHGETVKKNHYVCLAIYDISDDKQRNENIFGQSIQWNTFLEWSMVVTMTKLSLS